MRCPTCRAENIPGADICRHCGHDLSDLALPTSPGAEYAVPYMFDQLLGLSLKPLTRVRVSDPVGMAVHKMQSEDTGCVLVMRGDELAGIITTWDILHKVAGAEVDLNAVSCAQIMTADPVFLNEDDAIAIAINKMSVGGFRHIPLLGDHGPTAVVTIADVFRHISPHLT